MSSNLFGNNALAIKGLGHAVFPIGDVLGNDLLELKCFEIATFLLKTGGAPELVEKEQARGNAVTLELEGRLVNNYDTAYQNFWNREVIFFFFSRANNQGCISWPVPSSSSTWAPFTV